MATDIKKIITNLLQFYDFNNKTIITIGAGGGQLIEYGRISKQVVAVDYDREALDILKVNLIKSGLDDKFELVHSDFNCSDAKGDLVMFEFCLHEMEDPRSALKHALTMAPDILVLDHWPDSEWAFFGDEDQKIVKSWAALNEFPLKKIQKFDTVQFFQNYQELYQKVKPQGEVSINRIKGFQGNTNFTIPMSYGFALI
ncbi:MAG: methyltransferase domain-containing protein [Bacteroidetes bacterium]|nr:methyltransferase domain-containing protein [Bacteroidota bacterium]